MTPTKTLKRAMASKRQRGAAVSADLLTTSHERDPGSRWPSGRHLMIRGREALQDQHRADDSPKLACACTSSAEEWSTPALRGGTDFGVLTDNELDAFLAEPAEWQRRCEGVLLFRTFAALREPFLIRRAASATRQWSDATRIASRPSA